MSTRSNIIIKDKYSKLYFYRHCDGYPTGHKALIEFMNLVKNKIYRDNVLQSSGWLIILGHEEYKKQGYSSDWQVGAYEPTCRIHGDIEYLYELDLENMVINCKRNSEEEEPYHIIKDFNIKELEIAENKSYNQE